MRKILFSILIVAWSMPGIMLAQGEPEYPQIYSTSGFEFIFSWAGLKKDDVNIDPVIRFAPVINFQSIVNYDLSEKMGFFSGLSIRNVGIIYDDPDSVATRKKHRTYNLGVPLGIKFGKMNGAMVYGGYEFELPINYKEKTIVNEVKDKFSVWFSSRVNTIQHGFFVGFQFPYGTSIKFKYYVSNFFNKDFTEKSNTGEIIKPYQNFDAHIFYFSLNFSLFKNLDLYYTEY